MKLLYISKTQNGFEMKEVPIWENFENQKFYFVLFPDAINLQDVGMMGVFDFDKNIVEYQNTVYKLQPVIPFDWNSLNTHLEESYTIPTTLSLHYPKDNLVIYNRDTRKSITISYKDPAVSWNAEKKFCTYTLNIKKSGRLTIHLQHIITPGLSIITKEPEIKNLDDIF